MKYLHAFIKLFRGWVFKMALSMLAAYIRKDAALAAALKAYWDNETFLNVVRIYAYKTGHKDDDRVIAAIETVNQDLKQVPFRALVKRYFGGVTLPDLDGDPTNDVAIPDAVDRLMEEVFIQR